MIHALLITLAATTLGQVASSPSSFIEVTPITATNSLELRLTSDQAAFATEARKIKLKAGKNRLRYDWTRERIDEGTLRFSIDGDAKLVTREKVKRIGNAIYLDVESPTDREATLTARYLLLGIGWRVDYVGEVSRGADGGERLSLEQSIEISNGCGRDLEHARIAFDGGRFEDFSVAENEKRQRETWSVAGIPLTRSYVFDLNRFGGVPGIELEFKNDSGSGLGKEMLPGGKVRILDRRSGNPQDPPVWVGEDVLPATAIGELAKFSPGSARDVTVERGVLFQGNENERRDRWSKVVVFDQRTKLHYKVRNGSGAATKLKLVEYPGAPFESSVALDGLAKTRSDRLEREISLDKDAVVEFDIEWLRRNLF